MQCIIHYKGTYQSFQCRGLCKLCREGIISLSESTPAYIWTGKTEDG